MLRKIIITIAVIMLAVGIGLVAFPPVSNFIGTQISKGQTAKFDAEIENIVEDESYEEALNCEIQLTILGETMTVATLVLEPKLDLAGGEDNGEENE